MRDGLMVDAGIRHSDVDGFTIVQRKGRRPTIHLLRPWNECNTEKGKSGSNTTRVEGGRELLAITLSEMGYSGGVSCKRCFRYSAEDDVYTPVEEYEDGADAAETVNRRETLESEAP